MIPTGEMLKSVGFGEKKVSETAEMLNMLNFLGFSELMGYGPGGPKKSLTCLTFPQREAFFLAFKPTKFNITPVRSTF